MWQPMIFLPAPRPGIISADAAGATDVKTRTLAIALMMLCLFAQAGRAETREEINQARRDLADDLQQCLVLFYVASTCVADQDAALALSYRKAVDKLDKLAISSYRATGLSEKASKKAHVAGGFLIAEMLMKDLVGNCAVFGTPRISDGGRNGGPESNRADAVMLAFRDRVKTHMNFCQELARDPGPRLLERIKCVQAKDLDCRRR
jgi:hypothetical protein